MLTEINPFNVPVCLYKKMRLPYCKATSTFLFRDRFNYFTPVRVSHHNCFPQQ